jgi:tRNA(fMet)-specific endonuclease VapC
LIGYLSNALSARYSNAVIALLKSVNSPIARKVRQYLPFNICISSIVAHELFYGAFKSQRVEHNTAVIDDLPLNVLEFDKEDARHAGEIRALLARRGTPIGPYDVLIAGQARARGLVLVSRKLT